MIVTDRNTGAQLLAVELGDRASQFSLDQLTAFLDGARYVDADNHMPNDPSYTWTADVYWATADAFALLAARQVMDGKVTQFQSEQTTFAVERADFGAVSDYYRRISDIGKAMGYSDRIGHLDILTGGDYLPTSGGAYRWLT